MKDLDKILQDEKDKGVSEKVRKKTEKVIEKVKEYQKKELDLFLEKHPLQECLSGSDALIKYIAKRADYFNDQLYVK